MARVRPDEVEKFSKTGGSYFQLKDDGDSATVRFMYDSLDDLFGYSVHEVEVGESDYKRSVDCLREDGAPISDCPFCESGMRTSGKFYLQLFNEDEDAIQVWERGNAIWKILQRRLEKVSGDVVGALFLITRVGKKGDQKTTYDIEFLEEDDTTLDDLPEIEDVVGTIVMDKSYEEMEYYLDHYEFEEEGAKKKKSKKRNGREVSSREAPKRRPRKEVEEDAPRRKSKKVVEEDYDDEDEEVGVAPKRSKRSKSRVEKQAPAKRSRRKSEPEEDDIDDFDGDAHEEVTKPKTRSRRARGRSLDIDSDDLPF